MHTPGFQLSQFAHVRHADLADSMPINLLTYFIYVLKNVTFPHEAIRGINFSSAQVDAFPHHEWPEATSDREMHPRVLRKC